MNIKSLYYRVGHVNERIETTPAHLYIAHIPQLTLTSDTGENDDLFCRRYVEEYCRREGIELISEVTG